MPTQYPPETIKGQEALNVDVSDLAKSSFTKIAPFWPLQNLIAVNPLQGFEDLPIEDAMKMAFAYFEQPDLPQPMLLVNIETIKWLQAYFDEGQATITLPLRKYGFYKAWRALACYDRKIHKNIKENIEFLRVLPKTSDQAIVACLNYLGIAEQEQIEFLTLLLTTLPGWASYIKYKTEWETSRDCVDKIKQTDYLAVRLIITQLLWPKAKQLLYWHRSALEKPQKGVLNEMQATEEAYRIPLLKKLAAQTIQQSFQPDAQLIFCIDVRSEPFRKTLESIGNYQTFGFAGFFGIPVSLTDKVTGNTYASCPVLLTPKHQITEAPCTLAAYAEGKKGYARLVSLKQLYQSLKYTFSTPFVLVEALGIFAGIWMLLKTLFPRLASKAKTLLIQTISKPQDLNPSIDAIPFEEQCAYAEGALRMMGLTHCFASLVVFCGHGSSTQNNAYATALDCGACGGRHGGSNAKILAAILNRPEVKTRLAKNGIYIPETTQFLAAEHNTTTDEVVLYGSPETEAIQKLKQHLAKARTLNSEERLRKLGSKKCNVKTAQRFAEDWAQVRPEWGLARNAAFIVAPRELTSSLALDGRCFLHSYDYTQDPEGTSLTTILTAPMVVAEWINMQYLFSTMHPVAYGGGSKITKNITGKMGVMQGNASDLMTGLPLQSLYRNDQEPYHELQRLMVVVLAPPSMLDKVIQSQDILQKLFGHGWVQMAVIEPNHHQIYLLKRDFSWQVIC